jgi:hypothetical protein
LLPNNDPNKEILAKELLERLVLRFRGEIQEELGELSSRFTQFVILPDEKVCTGIDRLNGIVQKLIQHGQPPTEATKLSKTERGDSDSYLGAAMAHYLFPAKSNLRGNCGIV